MRMTSAASGWQWWRKTSIPTIGALVASLISPGLDLLLATGVSNTKPKGTTRCDGYVVTFFWPLLILES